MPLWFRKKEKKSESKPKAIESKSAEKKSADDHSLTGELDTHVPLDPILQATRSTGLRSFKLPSATGDAQTSVPSSSTVSASKETPAHTVASRPVSTEASVFPQAEISPDTLVLPVSGTDAHSQKISTRPSVPTKEPAVSPKIKPRVQVADRSDVPIPRTEATAADMPDVSRSDPKALYYSLMNGLYDVVFVLDDDGHILDCNARTEEIFGYSSDYVWNMKIEKIVYGMNSRMFSILKKNLTNKRHILIDARCFRSNGTSFLGEIGVSTVQLTRSENVVFSIRNVERRKNSAEELRKYRAAINVLPMPVFACDLHGQFEVMNPPVLKALGMVDEMEAQKKNFGEMLPDMVDYFQAAAAGENIEETQEIIRPDGTVCTMKLRLKPMRKGEEITGVAGTMIFI